MSTTVRHVTPAELIAERDAILGALGLTYEQLRDKAEREALIGREWAAWSEIENIEYLLEA